VALTGTRDKYIRNRNAGPLITLLFLHDGRVATTEKLYVAKLGENSWLLQMKKGQFEDEKVVGRLE
jgi:hypothetical protein